MGLRLCILVTVKSVPDWVYIDYVKGMIKEIINDLEKG